MVHGPTTTSPSNPWNASVTGSNKIHFLPRILVAPDHDARLVAIEQEQRFLRRLVSEEPSVKHTRIRPRARAAGTHQSSRVRLKYGLVEFET